MNNYQGYLVKAANGTILDKYFSVESYSTTPDQRQDKNSYRDGVGELHRTVLTDVVTNIEFSTLEGLTLDEKIAFQEAINSGLIDKQERKTTLTYWNDETNSYCTDTFYIPDTKFSVIRCNSDTIYYAKTTFQFIGYGADRTEDNSSD